MPYTRQSDESGREASCKWQSDQAFGSLMMDQLESAQKRVPNTQQKITKRLSRSGRRSG